MPIRPENRDRYGTDWPAFSRAIRFDRATGRCECAGECGRGTHDGRCPNRHDQPAYGTGSGVVLTVAHLCHTPECRDHVKAMCQGCHLHYDREHHAQTRAATKAAEVESAGQSQLPPAPRPHDLPPRWDGCEVEWRGWELPATPLCAASRKALSTCCTYCGSTASPVTNTGTIYAELHGLPTIRLGNLHKRAVVGRLYASRCPDCRHDTVLDGLGPNAALWDLDDDDYGDDGSRAS